MKRIHPISFCVLLAVLAALPARAELVPNGYTPDGYSDTTAATARMTQYEAVTASGITASTGGYDYTGYEDDPSLVAELAAAVAAPNTLIDASALGSAVTRLGWQFMKRSPGGWVLLGAATGIAYVAIMERHQGTSPADWDHVSTDPTKYPDFIPDGLTSAAGVWALNQVATETVDGYFDAHYAVDADYSNPGINWGCGSGPNGFKHAYSAYCGGSTYTFGEVQAVFVGGAGSETFHTGVLSGLPLPESAGITNPVTGPTNNAGASVNFTYYPLTPGTEYRLFDCHGASSNSSVNTGWDVWKATLIVDRTPPHIKEWLDEEKSVLQNTHAPLNSNNPPPGLVKMPLNPFLKTTPSTAALIYIPGATPNPTLPTVYQGPDKKMYISASGPPKNDAGVMPTSGGWPGTYPVGPGGTVMYPPGVTGPASPAQVVPTVAPGNTAVVVIPQGVPTTYATTFPSAYPTSYATTRPTVDSMGNPTTAPTTAPTSAPTTFPTTLPTTVPSTPEPTPVVPGGENFVQHGYNIAIHKTPFDMFTDMTASDAELTWQYVAWKGQHFDSVPGANDGLGPSMEQTVNLDFLKPIADTLCILIMIAFVCYIFIVL